MFIIKQQEIKKVSYIFFTVSSMIFSSAANGMLAEEDSNKFQIFYKIQVDNSDSNSLLTGDDVKKYRNNIKKDVKIRQRMIYAYEVQKTGEVLFKYVTPVFAKTAGILILVPDPSGASQIAGASVGLAAAATGAGGFLIK